MRTARTNHLDSQVPSSRVLRVSGPDSKRVTREIREFMARLNVLVWLPVDTYLKRQALSEVRASTGGRAHRSGLRNHWIAGS